MLLGLHFGSLHDTKEPLHSRKNGNQMVQAHGARGARLWSPLHKFPTQGDLKHPRRPSKTWDQLTSPKDCRSIKLITKTSPNKDLSNQVKGYLLSLSRVHILGSSQTLQKSLINDIMGQALALSQWQCSWKSVLAGFSPKSESSIHQTGSLEPFLSGSLISTIKELTLLSWESGTQ